MKTKIIITTAIALFTITISFGIFWSKVKTQVPIKQKQVTSCTDFGKSLIGLGETDAIQAIKNENRNFRIAQRDNETYPLSTDFNPERISLFMSNNMVISFNCG